MPKRRVSGRVRVRPGATAVAPKVEDPRGFAVENASGEALTVSFRFDPVTHVVTVVVEGKPAAARLPPELGGGAETDIAGGQA